ncbi:MAG: threonine--tRNA ligase, partial [Allobaculum sp.]|nr:threonine--tRNA ligase [Allobaculum sp.]
LEALGMRVQVDDRNEKLGYRVREAQVKKVPYQLVVGDRDIENGTVTVRKSGSKQAITMALDEALAKFKKEVDDKCLFIMD